MSHCVSIIHYTPSHQFDHHLVANVKSRFVWFKLRGAPDKDAHVGVMVFFVGCRRCCCSARTSSRTLTADAAKQLSPMESTCLLRIHLLVVLVQRLDSENEFVQVVSDLLQTFFLSLVFQPNLKPQCP